MAKQKYLNVNLWHTLILLLCLSSCYPEKKTMQTPNKYPVDFHSFAQPNHLAVKHLSLNLKADFEQQILSGSVTLKLERNNPEADTLYLDALDLKIIKAEVAGKEVPFQLAEKVEHLGSQLAVVVGKSATDVTISYQTSPDAAAVQWLAAEQTAGKVAPFLFTQGQAILTRSWVPLQDSPMLKITYDAQIEVPSNLLALMSAENNPKALAADGKYSFKQSKPIAPYLMALAIGRIAYKGYQDEYGVYAEPELLEKSFNEFVDMPNMVSAASKLYGNYMWGRYDVLVLPPSFPFGGMENPCLTFATPTILAGDRSLVSLVAHELAHSWSGNLVTNKTWDDFWLNEGFTVYFERRIMEAIEGPDYAEMLESLGFKDLQRTFEDLKDVPDDTKLKLNLKGRNPDDGVTEIAYEKGYFLLRYLENLVGREKWDAFLNKYFSTHAYGGLTTEEFLPYLETNLLLPVGKKLSDTDVEKWVYQQGYPESGLQPTAKRFQAVQNFVENSGKVYTGDAELQAKWSTHEWLYFLNLLGTQSLAQMAELDKAYKLSATGNSEIACVWFQNAAKVGYQPAFPAMKAFLNKTGRRKFLMPIYKALLTTETGKAEAIEIYKTSRQNYHFVARRSLDELLGIKA